MHTRIPAIAFAVWCAATSLQAQDIAPGAATPQDTERLHEELRALRDGLIKATNDSNLDALLTHLHPNIVVTWQNAEVSRGHAGVREYLQRMLSGPNPVVRGFRTTPTVDELTILYGGNTAGIAFGSSRDLFELTNGTSFELNGRWSATLVREGGRWLVASFHASANLFDNPVLTIATRATVWTGGGGLLLGMAIGGLFIALRRRRA